jgi:hypothetical protein
VLTAHFINELAHAGGLSSGMRTSVAMDSAICASNPRTVAAIVEAEAVSCLEAKVR